MLADGVKHPRRKQRGFKDKNLIKQTQRLGHGFFALMVLDISTNDLRCHLIANGADKRAIFPEFAAPQPALDAGKLTKNGPGPQAFQPGHYWGHGVPRRKGAKNMEVIGANLHCIDPHVILERDIGTKLLHALLPVTTQDVSAIWGGPDSMVLGVIDDM